MILKRLFKKKPDHYYSAGGDDRDRRISELFRTPVRSKEDGAK